MIDTILDGRRAPGAERGGDLLAELAAILEREGVPAWGTGPAQAMEAEPPGRRPSDLVPGAQGLICFGIPVPRAVFEQPAHVVESNWRIQNLHYRRLDALSTRLALRLEEQGARAAPVFGCLPVEVQGFASISGYLNQIEMGVATRMGSRGRNGLLFHPRHGSRLMLGGVVTTAALPSRTWPGAAVEGCPAGCRACVDACPVGAIRLEARRVEIPRCLRHTSRTPFLPKWRFAWRSLFSRERAARLLNQTSMDDHTLHVCSRCVSACPV